MESANVTTIKTTNTAAYRKLGATATFDPPPYERTWIYGVGPGKIGKTSTFARQDRLLLLDMQAGGSMIPLGKGSERIAVDNWSQIVAVHEQLMADKKNPPFDTVMFDPLSNERKFCMEWYEDFWRASAAEKNKKYNPKLTDAQAIAAIRHANAKEALGLTYEFTINNLLMDMWLELRPFYGLRTNNHMKLHFEKDAAGNDIGVESPTIGPRLHSMIGCECDFTLRFIKTVRPISDKPIPGINADDLEYLEIETISNDRLSNPASRDSGCRIPLPPKFQVRRAHADEDMRKIYNDALDKERAKWLK